MEKKCSILIAEDEADFREFLKMTLENNFGEQVSIQLSADGSDAVKKVGNQRYDCIITDLDMPKRDGENFIKIAREKELNRETPIIVITAKPETKIIAKKVGILPKPLNGDLLVEALSKLLSLSKIGV